METTKTRILTAFMIHDSVGVTQTQTWSDCTSVSVCRLVIQ